MLHLRFDKHFFEGSAIANSSELAINIYIDNKPFVRCIYYYLGEIRLTKLKILKEMAIEIWEPVSQNNRRLMAYSNNRVSL